MSAEKPTTAHRAAGTVYPAVGYHSVGENDPVLRPGPADPVIGGVQRRSVGLLPVASVRLMLVFVAPMATVLAAVALWHVWAATWGLAVALTVLFAALLVSGIVLLGEPSQSGSAAALIGSAAGVVLSWSYGWPGPFPYLATVLSYASPVLAGWALYRYPESRLSTGDRALWSVAATWFLLMPFAVASVSRPQWHEFPASAWWLTLWSNHSAFRLLTEVENVGIVVISAVVVVGWIRRFITTRQVERRSRGPVAAAAAFGIAVAATEPVASALGVAGALEDALYTAGAVGAFAIPIGFLVAVLRRHLAHARLSALVLRLRSNPTPQTVLRALREALEDPTVAIYYWSVQAAEYVDDRGSVYLPSVGREDLVAQASAADGSPLAIVVADPALHRDPGLIRATVTALSFGLENARLIAQVNDQFLRLQAVSERVVRAADAERRSVEQNLHDSVQQHFLALGLQIAMAEAVTDEVPTKVALADMRVQLRYALSELRTVVQGLRPAALRFGLSVAIQEAAARYPFEVTVDLPAVPLSDTIELTAYFAISEAVANAAKHAQPKEVKVSSYWQNGKLVIDIVDDGRGGAQPSEDSRGLTGIRDRVTALGGQFLLRSEVGHGTQLRVILPCE